MTQIVGAVVLGLAVLIVISIMSRPTGDDDEHEPVESAFRMHRWVLVGWSLLVGLTIALDVSGDVQVATGPLVIGGAATVVMIGAHSVLLSLARAVRWTAIGGLAVVVLWVGSVSAMLAIARLVAENSGA